MHRTILLLGLLISAIVLVDLSFVVMARSVAHDHPAPVPLLMFALACSQTGLFSMFFVFGPGRLILRAAVTALGAVAWGWLMRLGFGHEAMRADEWSFYFTVLLLTAALPLAIAFWRGVRLRRSWRPPELPQRSGESAAWQFSLRGILIWTAVVAVLLAARHLIGVPVDNLFVLPFYIVSNVIITVAVLWSVLGTGPPWSRLSATALLAVPISTALKQIEEAGLWPMAAISSAEFVLSAAMLAVVRICGYRFVRIRWDQVGETENDSAENDFKNVAPSASIPP